MQKESDDTTREESYGPVRIERRTLSKLTGMAGVALLAPPSVTGVAATESDDPTILMNIQPLYDRVLVQIVESDDRTASGRRTEREAIVRATGDGPVGDDGEPIPLRVREGDKVLFEGDTGTEVTIGGEEHLIIREGEILAIVED